MSSVIKGYQHTFIWSSCSFVSRRKLDSKTCESEMTEITLNC